MNALDEASKYEAHGLGCGSVKASKMKISPAAPMQPG